MITLFGKNMCESCFAENTKDPCEKCGFSSADYQQDSTALPIGHKLQERYLIGGIIGKGGFGITYIAFDTKLERRVAVKEYYPYGIASRTPGTTMVSSSSDAEDDDVFSKGAEKFYDEARLVAKFSDNQNIVSIYDFFYENSTVYYVMEYLQGQSMKKYIAKHGVVSAEQAVYIAKEVSNALVSSHSANVLHRDIAPDNIMLCNNGKVKLIDFGAARQVISEGSQSLSVILKQGFAPLEQYQKKGKQGPWTDIYALGATIYYLTTGDLLDDPMTRMDDDESFSSNMYNINNELWAVIKKATMLKPADRYKDIFEFRDDLNNIGIGSVPLTISYGAPSRSGAAVSVSAAAHAPAKEASPVGATMPAKEASPVGATMPVKEASPIGATMPAKEAAPVGATMPVKEASPVGATMPAKEASPIGATMPAKEASPIGATMPVKEASPIGATMPAKEASPIGATMPAKEASPIGATMPAKEASPIGATMPVKELPPQKSGIFVETDADYDEKSYQSAAAVAEQLSKKKKMRLIIGLSICVIVIIISICGYASTHVKIGDSLYSCFSGFVRVRDEKITDLSKLAEKNSIREISFYRCTFPDPSVLEKLEDIESLRILEIHSCELSDISALKGLTKLTELYLGFNKISDISALSGLTNLEVLKLNYNNISDISALSSLTNLKELELESNNISDISALSSLTNLKELDLESNNISDISALSSLTNLEKLDIHGFEIKITDLSTLKKLTNLEDLWLTYKGKDYWLTNAEDIKDFLDKNVKTTAAAAEPKEKKPAVTEKPAETESAKSKIVIEKYTDGSVYAGEIENGKRNGYGKYTFSDGDVYEGEFKDGKKNGQGTYKSSGGWVYEGEFKNDKRDGQGTITFSSGEVYEGEWKNDQRSGQGTITFSDGDVYAGEWKNDKMNGQGTYKFSSGDVYVGEFKNDNKHGQGTYTFKDGTVLKGTFKDDKWVG